MPPESYKQRARRSSDAFSSRTASLYAGPSRARARHMMDVVLPVPGGPCMQSADEQQSLHGCQPLHYPRVLCSSCANLRAPTGLSLACFPPPPPPAACPRPLCCPQYLESAAADTSPPDPRLTAFQSKGYRLLPKAFRVWQQTAKHSAHPRQVVAFTPGTSSTRRLARGPRPCINVHGLGHHCSHCSHHSSALHLSVSQLGCVVDHSLLCGTRPLI